MKINLNPVLKVLGRCTLALLFSLAASTPASATGNGDDMQDLGTCPMGPKRVHISFDNPVDVTLPGPKNAQQCAQACANYALDSDGDGDFSVGCESCPKGQKGTDGGNYCTVQNVHLGTTAGLNNVLGGSAWDRAKGICKCKSGSSITGNYITITYECGACVECGDPVTPKSQ